MTGPQRASASRYEGTLTFLRTRGSGATKRDITFTRTAEGLTCTAKDDFVRENGTGRVVLESGIDGAKVTLISWKLISSSCRVTRQPHPLSKQ
jgi:hypothetical protein